MAPGIFELKSAHDLLKKLEQDYEQLERNPLDSCTCFNFFVTAEHMPEWYYCANSEQANRLRRTTTLLSICSHLANGAKHFVTTDSRHTKIKGTHISQILERDLNPIPSDPEGGPSEPRSCLSISISPQDAAELGVDVSVNVVQLASMVLDYWKKTLANTVHLKTLG